MGRIDRLPNDDSKDIILWLHSKTPDWAGWGTPVAVRVWFTSLVSLHFTTLT
ncbi:hypothetical protein O9992_00820 [Vibrio lentus]|nr:hypothetical protein [Vibrio lentus]